MLRVHLILTVVFIIHSSHQQCDPVTFKNIRLDIKRRGISTATITGCITPETLSGYEPNTLESIHVQGQNVPQLNRGALANFSDSFSILFSKNNLHTIKQGAFLNLPQLKEIKITDNDLKVIETEAFANLPGLKVVDFRKNKISFLERSTFKNLPMLLSIELQHNYLEFFEQEWFDNTPKLNYIDLSHNSLVTVPRASFSSLPALEWIELDFNKVQQIHRNAFEGLEKLMLLDVSHNNIKRFDVDLSSAKSLEELLLHMNNITYLPDRVIRDVSATIRILELFPNPLQCKCFDKLVKWGHDNNIVLGNYTQCVNKNNPVCVTLMEETGNCLESVDDGTISYINNQYYANFNFNCYDH